MKVFEGFLSMSGLRQTITNCHLKNANLFLRVWEKDASKTSSLQDAVPEKAPLALLDSS